MKYKLFLWDQYLASLDTWFAHQTGENWDYAEQCFALWTRECQVDG